jgi:hypothetical protein
MHFLALYKSSTTTTTGCVKQFATTEREELTFTPQVQRLCDLCQSIHNFRLDRVVTVATPRQRKNVRTYCEELGIDLDIEANAESKV